jgi:hypothetical protein
MGVQPDMSFLRVRILDLGSSWSSPAAGRSPGCSKEIGQWGIWRLIELSPARGSCQQEGVSGEHGSKCLGSGGAGIFANISGDPLWVKAVVRGLEARNVRLAS